MIEGLMLASGGYFGSFYGGAMGDVLARWEQAGVFSYMLPFLLIFAVVFGILGQTRIFQENRTINGIIALVVALLALQFDIVPLFFSEIFPRVGIGLAIILVAMILLGMFAPNRTWVTYTFFAIGAVIFVYILGSVSGLFGFGGNLGFLVYEYLHWIVLIVLVGVVIASSIPPRHPQDVSSNFMRALFGGDQPARP
jgi:hypothetical protein